ncbi:MAG: leucine-rich repeat domain-containing protein [Oscillospiraceae bacterium]|nr:leucine-rich repeat domain-containing protein [Oscillospiraceae bacterium]
MNKHFKKILAGIVSATMVLSSFSAFAADNDIRVVFGDMDDASEIIVEDIAIDNETPEVAEDAEIMPDFVAEDEIVNDEALEADEDTDTILEFPDAEATEEETKTPDMSVWDIPTLIDLNEKLSAPVALSSSIIANGTCGTKLTWTLDSDGTLTIDGTGNMSGYGDPTTSAQAPWYKYVDSIKRLVLNNDITSIGNYAFAKCTNLTGNLVIPDSVTSIGESAFWECSGLTGKLVIPDTVTSIGSAAFWKCSGFTGNLVIPEGITEIGSHTFAECRGLTGNLVIPEGVTDIGIGAFQSCSGFTGELIIPDSVTKIGNSAFNSCSGLTGNLVIPKDVTVIENSAFYHCTNLTGNLVLPNGVTKIGLKAFSFCSGFTGDLIIPDSVTNIEEYAFFECSSFDGKLNISDSVTKIGATAFYGCSGFTGELIIPNSVTYIDGSAFYGCSGFTGELIIPDSVTKIGNSAFNGCSGLTGNLVIPDSVTSIGNNAFGNCRDISDMYIPQEEDSLSTGGFPNRVHWKYDLSKCTATISDYICTGEAIVPDESSITVKSPKGKTLYYGTDYVIESAKNNVAVGVAYAHIAPPSGGISIESQDVPFNIIGIDISPAIVTFPEDISWQGEPACPEITVVLDGTTLYKDKDYTVEYSDNNGEGTGKATITGIGKYINSKTEDFVIGPFKPWLGKYGKIDINDDTVSATINGEFIYDTTAKEPIPVLVYNFTNETTGIEIPYDMVMGEDFEVLSYEKNVDAGKAIVTIQGIGVFEKETAITFDISARELTDTTIADFPSMEYNKEDICPDTEIKVGDVVMKNGVDYELEYSNNRNAGTATVTIKGKGNLTGTVTKEFEITPRDGSRFTYVIWL